MLRFLFLGKREAREGFSAFVVFIDNRLEIIQELHLDLLRAS